jgi:small subunit ribosomal protein S21
MGLIAEARAATLDSPSLGAAQPLGPRFRSKAEPRQAGLCVVLSRLALAPADPHRPRAIAEGTDPLQVFVRDNNVDQALRVLKKKMQREGVFREMKQRRFYEKPSAKTTREKGEAVRRARKAARKQAIREGLIAAPPKKKLELGRGRPGAPSRNGSAGPQGQPPRFGAR